MDNKKNFLQKEAAMQNKAWPYKKPTVMFVALTIILLMLAISTIPQATGIGVLPTFLAMGLMALVCWIYKKPRVLLTLLLIINGIIIHIVTDLSILLITFGLLMMVAVAWFVQAIADSMTVTDKDIEDALKDFPTKIIINIKHEHADDKWND